MTSESHPTPSRETAEIAGHTPGPWRQGSDRLQSPELPTEIYASNGYLVGRCNAGNSHGKKGLSEHRTAIKNARMMAATLELLAALQIAVRQNSHDMLMTGEELRQCEAAIARATGDQK
ncbi:hypothetical protein J2W35_003234 [Variovorax boronicumulans]|uniref:hypothetical protein n=1 Tax=Variovorax boronicumulans TaxID=436515 RepID=UPI0027814D26|nr:hypothetical protein [Variovorax boronicumulans]MDQ0082875.1 hypothetical protein [Variovorax boronicumulans]